MFGIATAIQADGGLTLGEVLSSIPRDVPALVIYVMILAFAAFIWHGSRKKTS